MSRGRRLTARAGVLAAVLLGLLVLPAGAASAHPLGNFTVNRSGAIRVQPDRVLVDYVVDMAEIPAFQTRQALDADADGKVGDAEAARWRALQCPLLAARLSAEVDGRPLRFAVLASRLAFPPGQGGLVTLRLECDLAAPAPATGGSHALRYRDGNADGRIGWREVTAAGDRTTLEAADVPARSPSARLTAYPADLLRSPLDQVQATVRYRSGGPALHDGGAAPTGGRRPAGVDRATAAFTALVARQHFSPGFALLAVALAAVLGAAHALAPGHGKTVMAAYLVGMRGSARQAAVVGATVTATHTAGVLVLGAVLSASQLLAPERIYPWLGLASGLLLAAVGIALLTRALRGARHAPPADPAHRHGDDDHAPNTPGPKGHGGGPTGHGHPHRPDSPDPDGHGRGPTGHGHPHALGHHHRPGGGAASGVMRTRSLVALGFAGGLVPSPSAIVVLLGAIALGHAWFGVLLVVAYGAGMAATLTGLGLLLLRARRTVDRRAALRRPGWAAAAGRVLPLATASLIVLAGLVVAAQGAAAL
jgi:nickel/cobalt transporter (NicO) family protein